MELQCTVFGAVVTFLPVFLDTGILIVEMAWSDFFATRTAHGQEPLADNGPGNSSQ